jgi:uncharacterized membrane protein YraQ (UPF0718 family)
MMLYIVDGLLWALVGVLALMTAMRGRILFQDGVREGAMDFVRLLPKILLGVVGSGFIAEVMPTNLTGNYLGPESGFLGVGIAVIAGAFTPGGPVVGFSIGAAALKSGAGAPQVIAYVAAWALYAVQRIFIWELPIMPRRLVWLRWVATLPIPFLAAITAMLLGKP